MSNVLAIDASGSSAQLALIANDTLLGFASAEIDRSAEHLISLSAEVLSESKLCKHEIDLISVSLGPGSFTGIRNGIAAALGLSVGLAVPIRAISSLAAACQPHLSKPGKYLSTMKANASERYLAIYQISKGDSLVELVQAPSSMETEEFERIYEKHPDVALLNIEQMAQETGGMASILAKAVNEPQLGDFVDGDAARLEPVYIKRPNALTIKQRELRKKSAV